MNKSNAIITTDENDTIDVSSSIDDGTIEKYERRYYIFTREELQKINDYLKFMEDKFMGRNFSNRRGPSCELSSGIIFGSRGSKSEDY